MTIIYNIITSLGSLLPPETNGFVCCRGESLEMRLMIIILPLFILSG